MATTAAADGQCVHVKSTLGHTLASLSFDVFETHLEVNTGDLPGHLQCRCAVCNKSNCDVAVAGGISRLLMPHQGLHAIEANVNTLPYS